MSYFKPLLAAGVAFAALSSTASAQAGEYDVNYAPMHGSGAVTPKVAFSGGGLFGHNASLGDSIRKCYGHDTTQGGRNQSQRRYENSYFQWGQAFAANNPAQGVDIGFVSVQAGTSSDIGRDVCISPFGQSVDNNGGHNIGAFGGIFGLQPATAGAPFPGFWEIAFAWVGTSIGNINWLGVQANHPKMHPLLVNVIFEVQGPVNGANVQYYLGTTVEKAGLSNGNGINGTGGVTNGNALFGSAVYGSSADLTNAVSHTRLTATTGGGGLLVGPLPPFGGFGRAEMFGRLGFKTPVLWASNDGFDGAGGPDWRVGSNPISVADVRMIDTRAGAQRNFNMYWKAIGGPPAVATSIANPTLVFNQAYLFWSVTKSTGQQRPTSWDDLGGIIPAQKGSFLLGTVVTVREGAQTIPANFDSLMTALLPVTILSLLSGHGVDVNTSLSTGPAFSGSEDPFVDGIVPDSTGNSHSVIWEGQFDAIISGTATLANPLPIVGNPDLTLVGAKIGIAAAGLQLDAAVGFFIRTTEIANSLEVVFQP